MTGWRASQSLESNNGRPEMRVSEETLVVGETRGYREVACHMSV
jgi:hypothetical protein